jgi:hypothetical protein
MVVLVLPRAELADGLRSSLEGHPPVVVIVDLEDAIAGGFIDRG